MKKLLVLLMVGAIALSPLIQTEVQAAPAAKTLPAKHLKKANQKLKQKVKKLHQKLQKVRQHKQVKHHKSA